MALNLVNYSDSSSEEEIEVEKCAPVPKSKFPNPFDKPNKIEKHNDCASEHNGRIRSFPHERGNWATYVYIDCPKNELLIRLQDELQTLIKACNTLKNIDFHAFEELHLSLTRTVVLQHHWISEFVQSIELRLKNTRRFWINLNSIRIYCNDNQTRTFVSLLVDTDSSFNQNLQNIVRKLDDCLEEFKLPPFYQEASFHVSLLWCLGDKREELEKLLPQFCSLTEHICSIDNSSFTLDVEKLLCKIGNKLYGFHCEG